MTTVPRRIGRRGVCGLAAIVATVSTVLASQSQAGAATHPHSPHAADTRNIRHARQLRATSPAPPAAPPRTAPKASRPARPSALAVPSIRLATSLMALGGPDGPAGLDSLALPVPPLAKAAAEAGWYQFSAVPGAAGNAVIVGHVDTYSGPGVFYNLYQLRPGDPIYVDVGGVRQRFDVTWIRELPKPSFPVNRVFGNTERHMLWLITCGGAFDDKTGHYLDNIVVSATWVPPHGKQRAAREIRHETSLGTTANDAQVAVIGRRRIHRLNLSQPVPPPRAAQSGTFRVKRVHF
jgi:hypothetical protein